jgi:hypothetical protein
MYSGILVRIVYFADLKCVNLFYTNHESVAVKLPDVGNAVRDRLKKFNGDFRAFWSL